MSLEAPLEEPNALKQSPSLMMNDGRFEKTLESHAFFAYLRPEIVQKLSQELVARVYNDNDYIIRKGEVGRAMFIIMRGTVDVVSDDGETTVRQMSEGDFFGEIGLLFSVPRANGRCILLMLTKQKFDDFLSKHTESAKVIARIAEERFQAYLSQQHTKKFQVNSGMGQTPEICIALTHLDLKNVSIFHDCEVGFLQMLSLELKPIQFHQNEIIVKKGDQAEEMYFVAQGEAEIINEQTSFDIAKFVSGSFFGEVGLFFNIPRTVSIRCASETIILFKLTKADLDKTLAQFPEIQDKIRAEAKKRFQFNEMRQKANLNIKQQLETEVEVIVGRLKGIPFCRNLPVSFLHELALSMKLRSFKANDNIVVKDSIGESMHFLIDGFVRVVIKKGEEQKVLTELAPPTFFGEVALFFDVPRTATVMAVTSCTTLELSKSAFIDAVSRHASLKSEIYEKAKEHYKEYLTRKEAMNKESDMDGYSIEVIKKKIESIPLFSSCDISFISSLALQFGYEKHKKDDVVIHRGEIPNAMYFVIQGEVEVFDEDTNESFASVSAGQYFGEVGILHGMKRTASIRVVSETCHLFVVTIEAIKKVSKEYPETYKMIMLEAEKRLQLVRAREQLNNEKQVRFRSKNSVHSVETENSVVLATDQDKDTKKVIKSPTSIDKQKKRSSVIKFINMISKPFKGSKVNPMVQSPKRISQTQLPEVIQQRANSISVTRTVKITDLDFDVFVKICDSLDIKTKFGLRLVCKKWNGLLTEKKAWTDLNFSSIANSSHHKLITAFCGMVGPYLSTLNLGNCWRLVDDDLDAISQCCTNIEFLSISNCWNVTDKGLAFIRELRELKTIDLSYCSKITGVTLEEHSWSNLQELNISYCKLINHTTMENILMKTPNLVSLKFRRCNRTSDYAIFAIARHCRMLKRLDLADCDQVNDVCLKWIGTGCMYLEFLNLTFCQKITTAGIQELTNKAKQLKILNLSFCLLLDDRVGPLLARQVGLSALGLKGCYKITDGMLPTLATLKHLKVINIAQCPEITETGAAYMQQATNCHVIQ